MLVDDRYAQDYQNIFLELAMQWNPNGVTQLYFIFLNSHRFNYKDHVIRSWLVLKEIRISVTFHGFDELCLWGHCLSVRLVFLVILVLNG